VKTTVTTRDFDDDGRLIRETEVIYDSRLGAIEPASGHITVNLAPMSGIEKEDLLATIEAGFKRRNLRRGTKGWTAGFVPSPMKLGPADPNFKR
jgi:hypothetical protein